MSSLTHHTDFLHQLSPIRNARMLTTLRYLIMTEGPVNGKAEKHYVNNNLFEDIEDNEGFTSQKGEQAINDLVNSGLVRIPKGSMRLEITDRGYSKMNEKEEEEILEEGQPHG